MRMEGKMKIMTRTLRTMEVKTNRNPISMRRKCSI